ncbi:hypothetical protein CAPTEDRAFT_204741 [Capitella teleta]|uniref:Gamma-secretase subunit Aph-1 n=1 Tax=Capitella teleta TaxID=283909 RepID=R7V908_CAPTE|nr:hypothetical protein CAPTEDRAFT_204741 [Capitella teleta]|eukprot:ELU12195.1 hypothetical protein CAPTEDRAFT_204741 [Capitella teleta]
MTLMEFFGCTFIAFGPPAALFILTIANEPLRVIVLIASAFFWLLSLLLSSIWWYIVIPLREEIAFGLVFSVIFQEIFRLLFYVLLGKAAEGLKTFCQQGEGDTNMLSLVNHRHLMAYVCGLGYGMVCGTFSLVNILADMAGPGTIGIYGDPQNFFLASAFMTLCMVLLHTFWGIIFFDGFYTKKYYQPIVVVLSHLLVSCLTLLNERQPPMYLASILPAYASLVAMGIWAFTIVGGSPRSMKAYVVRES